MDSHGSITDKYPKSHVLLTLTVPAKVPHAIFDGDQSEKAAIGRGTPLPQTYVVRTPRYDWTCT